jgi:hypothetical protein
VPGRARGSDRNLGLRLNADVRNSDFVEGARISVGGRSEELTGDGGGGRGQCEARRVVV